jgi:hypothetical protein
MNCYTITARCSYYRVERHKDCFAEDFYTDPLAAEAGEFTLQLIAGARKHLAAAAWSSHVDWYTWVGPRLGNATAEQ